MTIFDLTFIFCILVAAIVFVRAAITAIRGHYDKALAILRKLGICAAIYMAIVLATGLAEPRKVYHLGDEQCFDDWVLR